MLGVFPDYYYYFQHLELCSRIFTEICPGCGKSTKEENPKMSSIPQGAFAAIKIKKNEEKHQHQFYDPNDRFLTTNYNSKYMDSIWGMYNRYSVHNLKKMMDFEAGIAPSASCQNNLVDFGSQMPSALGTLEYQVSAGNNKGYVFRFSIEKLTYLPM